MAQHDLVMIDPGKLGSKIREIRKQKQLTLVEVAERLGYASGKLSNIEKGKRVKFPISELQEIAKALNVTVDSFLEFEPNQLAEQYESARKKLIAVDFKMKTGLFQEVKDHLIDIENQIKQYSLIHLDAYLQFLYAEYYFKTYDLDKASHYFLNVIRSSSKDEDTLKVKLRAYQAVAKIEFEKGNFEEALERVNDTLDNEKEIREQALDLSCTFYNLSILYAYSNRLDLARYYIDVCKYGTATSDEMVKLATALSAIIYMMNKESNKAKQDLIQSMQLSNPHHDQEYYLWLMAIGLHFNLYQNKDEGVLFFNKSEIQSFLDLEIPDHLLHKKLECIHLWAKYEMSHHNYLRPLQILDNCKIYHNKLRDYKLKAATFKLEADIHKLSRNNEELVVTALKNAVYYYNDPLKNSVQKTILLYELAEYEQPELAENQIAKSFYQHYKNEYYQISTYHELLPELRY